MRMVDIFSAPPMSRGAARGEEPRRGTVHLTRSDHPSWPMTIEIIGYLTLANMEHRRLEPKNIKGSPPQEARRRGISSSGRLSFSSKGALLPLESTLQKGTLHLRS